jgi:hypothetical protein
MGACVVATRRPNQGSVLRRAWRAYLSPRFQLGFNVAAAAVWAALFAPGLLSWRESIPFLVFVSIYANFVGHLSGIAAAAGARKADPEDPL